MPRTIASSWRTSRCSLGLTLSTPERARTEIAAELIHLQAYGVLQQMMFSRPVSVRTWLQMSNPSERWKWDFLFQDLPPVKGDCSIRARCLRRPRRGRAKAGLRA